MFIYNLEILENEIEITFSSGKIKLLLRTSILIYIDTISQHFGFTLKFTLQLYTEKHQILKPIQRTHLFLHSVLGEKLSFIKFC